MRKRFFAGVTEKSRFDFPLRRFSRNPDLPLQLLSSDWGNDEGMTEVTYRKWLKAWRFEVVPTQGGVLFIGPNHFFSLPHEPKTKAERKIAIAHIRSLCKL